MSEDNDLLEDLKNVNINQLIPGFLATPIAIANLNSAQVDSILLALGQQEPGCIAERKKKLCFFIGLSAIVAYWIVDDCSINAL